MEKVKTYTPLVMEFILPDGMESEVICQLGAFEDKNIGAQKFISNTFVAFNKAEEVERKMDATEQEEAREAYRLVLEDELPELEANAARLSAEAKQAQERAKQAMDLYTATITRIKDLAHVAKMGITMHYFKANECWKVPVGDKYRYYAICGNELRLVKIEDIPQWEQHDLLNSMNQNQYSYNGLFPKSVAV